MKSKMLLMLASFLMVTTLVIPAFAVGATKFELMQKGAASGTESGFVVINVTEDKTIIQVQVRGMDIDPEAEYYVYYLTPKAPPSVVLGSLKLNKKGSGHFHIELDYAIPMGTPTSGTYEDILGYHFGISNIDTAPTSANVVMHTYVPAS